ncbi:hypothetical protein Dimus_038810 [Dionaea muscipula]
MGVAVDPSKIAAMVAWPQPRTPKALRGFLGLTDYYRKFIKNYGSIALPLTKMLKKDCFVWTSETDVAFQRLKGAMTTAPLLALPDFTLPFIIECDVFGMGIGAVLMQQGRPLAFFSKASQESNANLPVYDRKMLALVTAIQKWRPYLLNTPFIVRTDHHSLKYLWDQTINTEAQQKWFVKLMRYDFHIEYKKGNENSAADALSRSTPCELLALSHPLPHWLDPLRAELLSSPFLQQQKHKVESGAAGDSWSFRDGLLFHKGRLFIAPDSPSIPSILTEFHGVTHEGTLKLLHRIRGIFTWHGMKARIKAFLRECPICQRTKTEHSKPAGLLQPLPIPTLVWSDISMDFIDGLPPSGKTSIMVVVDRLSMYGHFVAIRHPYTAFQVAQNFIAQIVHLHEFPSTIVCDRDPIFTSLFWKELFRSHQVKFNYSLAYHPQTDGQTEVINRTLEMYLRCFAHENPRQWLKWLPWAEFYYNTSYHTAIKHTPFEIVYGRPAPPLLHFMPGSTSVAAVEDELIDRDQLLKEVRENLCVAQNRMRQIYDRKHMDRSFAIGNWVLLRLQPYRQLSLAARRNQKLAPRFYGPFQVLALIGKVAYRLALPPDSKLHPVFHVSQLKGWVGDILGDPTAPPRFEQSDILPVAILDQRTQANESEVLIQWQGSDPANAT